MNSKKHLEIALAEYGTWEWRGKAHNPAVLKYFSEIGYDWIKDDETSWCSAFINWACKKAGLDYSGKLDARSWLKVGKEVKNPKVGDIVIFWRESKSSWKGHVGIFISKDRNYVNVLGGNQGNQVNISRYSKQRVLGYRRL